MYIPTFLGHTQLDSLVKKFGSASYKFDGTDDSLYLNSSTDLSIANLTTDTITVDFWAKFISTSSPAQQTLFSYGTGGSNWVGLIYKHASGGWTFNILNVNSSYGGVISDTNWHHIALVKIGGSSTATWGIYVDGVQVVYWSTATVNTTTSNLYLGTVSYAGANYFNGYIDEFRIQYSNIFGGNPNVGLTDTIVVPTEGYDALITGGGARSQAFIIA